MRGRDTEWRQGDVLTDEHAYALGLIESRDSDRRVVIISHDCDLSHPEEKFVEVIVGSLVPASDSKYANARNPRRLHLNFESAPGKDMPVELRHADQQQVKES
ncbi:MAG: hypothetical protein ACSLE5_01565 [Porticoccaceae bacterium]